MNAKQLSQLTEDEREEFLREARQMLGLPAFTIIAPEGADIADLGA